MSNLDQYPQIKEFFLNLIIIFASPTFTCAYVELKRIAEEANQIGLYKPPISSDDRNSIFNTLQQFRLIYSIVGKRNFSWTYFFEKMIKIFQYTKRFEFGTTHLIDKLAEYITLFGYPKFANILTKKAMK
jgi:hypothetical protein